MERFLDSWQYAIKNAPIDKLMFEVKVYRTNIIDQDDRVLVCRRRFIPWAQKVFSPNELITLFNTIHSPSAANAGGSTREEQLELLLGPFEGSSLEEKMKAYLQDFARCEDLDELEEKLKQSEEELTLPPDLTPQKQREFLADKARAIAEIRRRIASFKQCYHVFTRPPTEGFMNEDELVSEVIPAQPMTDLAKLVLKLEDETSIKEKVDSDDDEFAANSDSRSKESAKDKANRFLERPDVAVSKRSNSFFICLAKGDTSQPTDTPAAAQATAAGLPVKFHWRGLEKVLIQLIKLNDGTLITRPALLEEHVISVDENFITSFTINLSSTRDGNAALVDTANVAKFLNKQSALVDGVAADDDDDGDYEEELALVETTGNSPPNAQGAASASGGKKGKKNNKKNKKDSKEDTMTEQQRKRAASNDKRWMMVRKNVVERGVALALAKRVQSPSTLDARGGVNAAKMLRQALGLHDDPNSAFAQLQQQQQQSNSNNNVKTGAQVFGTGRNGAIPTLAIPENAKNSNQNQQQQQDSARKKKKEENSFISCPPRGIRRVNFFVTVETVNGIERESVFARLSWVFPPGGVALDTEGNRKGGVRELMQITTQTAFASRMVDEQFNVCTRHVINVPLELHVLMHQNTPGTPRLVIEVFSGGDGGGHQTLEGYALLTCSPIPGLHKKRIDMWRPSMSGWEMMKSIFIGGSTSLVDRETVAVPYGKLALESQTLTNAVKREVALVQQQQQLDQQQQQLLNNNGDPSMMNNNMQQTSSPLQMMNTLNPVNLSPEVERDLAEACSVASHSRAGLITTSQGSVQISLMCAVQELKP